MSTPKKRNAKKKTAKATAKKAYRAPSLTKMQKLAAVTGLGKTTGSAPA